MITRIMNTYNIIFSVYMYSCLMVTEAIDLKNNMAKVLLKILIFTCVITKDVYLINILVITNEIILKYDR